MEMNDDDHAIGSQEGNEAKSTQQPNPHSRLACIQCRQRKIACNREDPCSGCIRAQTDCVYGPRQRPANKRQRLHLSDQYERRIESIGCQMTQVIDLLEQLMKKPNPTRNQLQGFSNPPLLTSNANSLSSLSATLPNAKTRSQSPPSIHGPNPQIPFEGDSSLAAHASFANTVLKQAASVSSTETPRPEMEDTLASLRTLIDALAKGSYTPQDIPPFYVSDTLSRGALAMPPIETVMVTLRIVKENSDFEYFCFNLFLPHEQFMEYVIKVYFPGGYDPAELIIVNAVLMDCFLRRANFESEATIKQELQLFAKACEDNLVTSLQRLPMHLPNKLNCIMALLLGVFYYMRSSKTSIAWTLATTALIMCQTHGMHRIQSMKHDNSIVRNQKIWTFWMLYSIEKGLSLRLGRPSTVQDYDITIPIPEVDPFSSGPFVYVAIRWIKLSQVQGKIYKRLYSPAGLADTVGVRSRWVAALVSEIQLLRATTRDQERNKINQWRNMLGSRMELLSLSDEVMFLSTMTLVMRACPVSPGSRSSFTADCIETGRRALECHLKYFDQMENVDGKEYEAYLNWTIMYTPFVPFIVIFCDIIESSTTTDLPRLQAFVQSLEAVSKHSENIAGMYRYFSVLYKVALQYTKKSSQMPIEGDAYRDFDAYVHALGLVCPGDSGFGNDVGLQALAGGQLDGEQIQSQQLGEWFITNQQLMGLMEENLF
ncbi:hypothetical protein B0T11DRAFT_288792 [Plectosphaerella cucumerina]|uniref:Zn(2)-C6 fungal-type domain-containing protein n=1 Tax=Plectosphaerella cucumerina TaxID=40658 RepID=A0A8K0X0Y8_9PEZI|nr:hypothetical protein B0T11DRAFT_288792 [Plectosphaerella cucumerina]